MYYSIPVPYYCYCKHANFPLQNRNKVTDAIGSWFFCIPQFCFKNFLGKSERMDLVWWQSCNSDIVKYIAIRSFRLFWRKVLQNFDRVHFREKKCCRNLDSSLGEKPTDFWQSSNNCGTSLSWRNLNAAYFSKSIITYYRKWVAKQFKL